MAASMVASAPGAENPSSGAAMSKRSTRKLRPRSAKNAAAPTSAATVPCNEIPNARALLGSGVTSASRRMATLAVGEIPMSIGKPSNASASAAPAIIALSAQAATAARRLPRSAATKPAASRMKASPAEVGIGAKSAPRSRSHRTSIAQPHSAIAASIAVSPYAAYATRVRRERSLPPIDPRETNASGARGLSPEQLRTDVARNGSAVASLRRRCFSTLEFREQLLGCADRRAVLRANEPHRAGGEQSCQPGRLRRLGVVALAPLRVRRLAPPPRERVCREKAEAGGGDQRHRRGEGLHRASAGLAGVALELRAPQREALLDFEDFLVGRNHCGFSGALPRSWRSSAVKGSSLMSANIHHASAPAPVRFTTAATISAVTQDAPWPSMNTTAAATSPIQVVTTSTAASSTAPSSQARRMAARRASRTASSV